jgi:phytoene synthase
LRVTLDSSSEFAACEAVARQHDPDRYFSALFAPAAIRPVLFALYALNDELGRIGEKVSQPMLGEIRLQWWRETLESARAGDARAHDVAQAMTRAFAMAELPQALFDAMIDARGFDCSPDRFANFSELEAYCDATAGALMRLVARALGAGTEVDAVAREAGIAYALTGLLRSIPFHAARNKLYLPVELLESVRLSPEDVVAGRDRNKLKTAMAEMALRARNHLHAARHGARPGKALAAFLPAAPVPAYLKRMTRPEFDPYRHPVALSPQRRQWVLLSAALRNRF